MKYLKRVSWLVPLLVLAACGSSGTTTGTGVKSSSSAVVSSQSSSSSVASSVASSSSQPPVNGNGSLPPDRSGMELNAIDIAKNIRIGLNIGNTLEAYGAKSETYWGNPRITQDFVRLAKQSGFNAIRLPVSWDQYADPETLQIDPAWLERVHQVVQYCIDEDMYVLVNIHWDGGWLEEHVTPAKQAQNVVKQKAYWQQIATLLNEFDGRLLFASGNEPNVEDAEQMAVLEAYHQAFVDTVRASGGRNAYRVLVVQGPSTDVEKTHELMRQLPIDTVAGRLMAEVHYYSPWNYTGMQKDEAWGNQFFYWGEGYHSSTDTAHNPTWGEEAHVDEMFGLMKAQFVDQGVPVILGEYGTGVREHLNGDDLQLHLAGRAHYFNYITQRALANGLLPFYWDTGALLKRNGNAVLDAQALEALIGGAAQGPHYWAEQ